MAKRIKYSDKLAKQICDYIMQGMGIREIGRIEGMPCKRSIFNWLAKHDEFMHQYARAKEMQADYMAEELIEIADDGSNDYMMRKDGCGGEVETINQEHIQRSRLRIDTRKWLMGKMRPKKYGEKILNENLNTNLNISADGLSDEELMSYIAKKNEK